MSLSKIIGLVWVLFLSVLVKGWNVDHKWLPLWVFILGLAYVIAVLAEWLGVIVVKITAPKRRVVAPTE